MNHVHAFLLEFLSVLPRVLIHHADARARQHIVELVEQESLPHFPNLLHVVLESAVNELSQRGQDF